MWQIVCNFGVNLIVMSSVFPYSTNLSMQHSGSVAACVLYRVDLIVFLLFFSLQMFGGNVDGDTVKVDVYVENAKIVNKPVYDFLESHIVPFAKKDKYYPRRDYYVINCYPKDNGDTTFFVTYEMIYIPFAINELSSKTKVVVTNIEGVNFYIPLGPEDYRWIEPQKSETYIGYYKYKKGDLLHFFGADGGCTWLLKSSKGAIELLSFHDFNRLPEDSVQPKQNKTYNDIKSRLPKRL